MGTLCVSRISRWALACVSVVLLSAFSFSPAVATQRIILSLDTVRVAPGQTSTLRVWLTNPVDSLAGLQIWLRVDRPNFVTLGPSVDTTGTALSGWEYLAASSPGGMGYDLLLTAIRNNINPPAQPSYAPHSDRNLMVKIPVTMPINPDTLFEKIANLTVEVGFPDRFSFADQNGNNIVSTTVIVSDTNCYRCQQWLGQVCLAWVQAATPPCDSIGITIDTLALLDTTTFHIDNSQAVLSNCLPVPMVADVNLDGTPLTMADLFLLIRYIVGDTSALPLPINADINGDCRISWEDAAIFSNYFIYGQPYLDTIPVADCNCPNPVRYCCLGTRGNLTSQEDQRVDISDLSLMVAYMITPGTTLKCVDEANVNGAGAIDISDLSMLINYLIQGGALPACP